VKGIWDHIIALIVTLFAVKILLSMLQPHLWVIAITTVVFIIGQQVYRRNKQW
jgi:hypothetical protein